MNGLFPIAILFGSLVSLIVWGGCEIKGGQFKNVLLGLVCLSLCSVATFFFTQMSYKAQAAYERNFSVSVITKLSKLTEPSKANPVTKAVEEFTQAVIDRDRYLPELIRLNQKVEEANKGVTH